LLGARFHVPRFVFPFSLACIVALGLWLRTHDLMRRPMHADEANQAVKLGELLDSGNYTFDPRDHHGPTLYYLALPIAWLRGERSLASLEEATVRLLPAIAGTIAVALVAWFGAQTGAWALAAAAFIAVSPPAVYYSRYFIQETLLVAFTLATIIGAQRWWSTGRPRWALASGACFGLAVATKEIAALFAAAALLSLALVRPPQPRSPRIGRDVAFAAGAALFVAGLFYSSFGSHLAGVRDAVSALARGWTRATGPSGYEKPWWYYLRLFAWQRAGGLLWDQSAFSALALGGFVTAFVRREKFLLAVAIYSLALVVALSVVPYKTPWHAIHLVPGFALLAAGGLSAMCSLRTGKIVAALFAFVALASLTAQTWRAAFVRASDPRNPLAYVHSSPDVLKFRALAEAARAQHPADPIRVISEEYWPLPWYFRGLPRVGYWSAPPDDCDGALVIASASQAGVVRPKLRARYRESFLGLRPNFVCVVFTREP